MYALSAWETGSCFQDEREGRPAFLRYMFRIPLLACLQWIIGCPGSLFYTVFRASLCVSDE